MPERRIRHDEHIARAQLEVETHNDDEIDGKDESAQHHSEGWVAGTQSGGFACNDKVKGTT